MLVDELFVNQQIAVLGFDAVFAEPDLSSGLPALERLAAGSPALASAIAPLRAELDFDARFARALAGRNVVLGYYLGNERARRSGTLPAPVFDAALLQGRPIAFTHWDGYAANLLLFARAAPLAGYFNNVPDPDGQVRAVPLISELDGRHYEPLALAVFRAYTGGPVVLPGFPRERWLSDQYSALQGVLLKQGDTLQAIPVNAKAQVRVPFRGPGGPGGGSFEYVSASDLLNHRVAPGHLKNKLVLLGSTAPGNYDQRSTPVGEVYPGVEVHANLLSGCSTTGCRSSPTGPAPSRCCNCSRSQRCSCGRCRGCARRGARNWPARSASGWWRSTCGRTGIRACCCRSPRHCC